MQAAAASTKRVRNTSPNCSDMTDAFGCGFRSQDTGVSWRMIARTRGLSSLIWATPIYRTRRATRRRTASPAVHDRYLCKPTGMICAPRPAIPSSNSPTTANVEVRRPTPSTAAGATPVSAAAEVAGERRYLTVMFCNLVESASTTGRSISTGLWNPFFSAHHRWKRSLSTTSALRPMKCPEFTHARNWPRNSALYKLRLPDFPS